VGTYDWWLEDLSLVIRDADLPAVLPRLAGFFDAHGDVEQSLEDVGFPLDELIRRGWEVWRDLGCEPLLRSLAVTFAHLEATVGLFRILGPHRLWDHTDADADDRRQLAVAVAEQLGATNSWFGVCWHLLHSGDDAGWLLQALPDLPASVQPSLAAQVARLARCHPWRETAEAILALPVDHPAYEATIHLREPCSLEAAPQWHPGEPDGDATTGHPPLPGRRHRPAGARLRAYRPKDLAEGLDFSALAGFDELVGLAPRVTAAVGSRVHAVADLVAAQTPEVSFRLDPGLFVGVWRRRGVSTAELKVTAPHIRVGCLDTDEVAQLAGVLLDHCAPATDRHPSPDGMVKDQEPRRTRDRIRGELVAAGESGHLERLTAARSRADRLVLRRDIRRARANAADQALQPPTPGQLVACLAQPADDDEPERS
jgi:hypothetical protein